MSYVLQATLVVLILACAMMVEAFWSGIYGEKDLTHSLVKSIATGGGFIAYAVIGYMLIVPEQINVIA